MTVERERDCYSGVAMELWTGLLLLGLIVSAWSASWRAVWLSVLALTWRRLLVWCRGVQYSGTARLEGQLALVTGANVGIGKAAATELARRGARLLLACRDLDKAEAARLEIIQETGVSSDQVQVRQLDLASFRSVR